MKRALILVILAFIALATGWQCSRKEKSENSYEASDSPYLNLADSARYVGMAVCAGCHADKHSTFLHTGMGQSFGAATLEKTAGKFHGIHPVYDKFSDFYYLPYFSDGKMFIKEYRLDRGDTVFKRIEQIDYIIGSGQHTNSHLILQDGYLTQAPLTYYVQKGKWDLPPGFENGFNSRFKRVLDVECLTCHNGLPKPVPGSLNKFEMIPQGIDCERCHGPGSIHVDRMKAGKTIDTKTGTDFSIVNPAKLPYDLQLDVCQRCHLQGNTILKPGKTFFDFRPGMKLSSIMDVYLPVFENQDKGFMMASHAERLHKSPCFLQSVKNGVPGLTCITCHNPHVSVKATKTEYFIQKCMDCHAGVHKNKPEFTQAGAKENCISCHMPKSGSVDIPHVTITDHYIRKNKETAKSSVVGVGAFRGLVAVNNPNPPVEERIKAFIYFYEKFDKKKYYLDSAGRLLATLPKHNQELSILYNYATGNWSKVTDGQNTAAPPATALLNYRMGQSYLNQNKLKEGLPYFASAVRMEPLNLDYRLRNGQLLMQTGDIKGAEREFDFIIKENKSIPGAWNGLAFIRLTQGDTRAAEGLLAKALMLDPDYAPALINKAKIRLADNQPGEAKAILKRLMKREPKNEEAARLLAYIDSFAAK